MALIEVRADLKALVAATTRIALALEEIVLRSYGVRLQPTPKPERDDSDVLYMDDQKAWAGEMRDLDQHRNPERAVDADDEL